MTPSIDERNLAGQARAGDHAALEQLVNHLRMPLFRLAYAELRNYEDAQDTVASTLLQIVLHIADLRETVHLRAWCSTILRNEMRRLRRLKIPIAETAQPSEACAVSPPLERSHLSLDIERALLKLPRDQARCLWLFYLNGLSVSQISRIMQAPQGTIKYWLHQGRHRLSTQMEDYQEMKTTNRQRKAAIISTDLSQNEVKDITAALDHAGWSDIVTISDFRVAGEIQPDGAVEASEPNLPPALVGCDCILLDEWINGRSSFELVALYNATAQREDVTLFCLLGDKSANSSLDISVHAAFALGVDAMLTKPFDIDELSSLARRIYLRKGPRRR